MRKESKLWRVREPNILLRQVLADKLGISSVAAQLLINRSLTTDKDARSFLTDDINKLINPELMTDLPQAAAIISEAIERKEKIVVYGDYDVDGITGTVILIKMLCSLGGNIGWYIPSRLREGYGLNKAAVERIAQSGCKLMVTVDCGVSNFAEVEYAKSKGLKVVVTDHHQVPDELPPADAIINPRRKDNQYSFKELAGAAVGWKLGQALYRLKFKSSGYLEKKFDDLAALQYLDLVALGTVADVVPLVGENRIIVKYGLNLINNTQNLGLKMLCHKVLSETAICVSEEDVAYMLAPRLNAAGRLDDIGLAVRLLMTEQEAEAEQLIASLVKINNERQSIEAAISKEALNIIVDNNILENKAIILASESWHPGVLGIVAARLADKYERPVILIALEDGVGKASCRSVPDVDMYRALEYCSADLLQFGGHSQAAGFSIKQDKIISFIQKFNYFVEKAMPEGGFITESILEQKVRLDEINQKMIDEINMFRPFGCANAKPFFYSSATVINSRLVGKNNNHLKLILEDQGACFDAIGFNMGQFVEIAAEGEKIEFIFYPEDNYFNGKTVIQLKLKAIKTNETVITTEKSSWHWAVDKINSQISDKYFAPQELYNAQYSLLNSRYKNYRPEENELPALSLNFIDQRDIRDRIESLFDLCREQGKTLILTGSNEETVELLAALLDKEDTTEIADSELAVLFDDNWLVQAKDADRLTIDLLQQGQYRVLAVETSTLLTKIAPTAKLRIDRIAVYSRIIIKEELYQVFNRLSAVVNIDVYFMGQQEELGLIDNLLQQGIPDRKFLGKLYLFFKQWLQNNRCVNIDEIIDNRYKLEKIGLALGEKITAVKFKTGVIIFTELGLLKNSGSVFRLNDAAPEKTELKESDTFCRLNSFANAIVNFQQQLDGVPHGCLQELFI